MPRVVVLEFTRSPEWFFQCLVAGEALDVHRVAMLAVGRPCFLGEGGAKLIMGPYEINDALLHLRHVGVTFDTGPTLWWDELRPRHVIVSDALEAAVMAALAECEGSGKDGGKGKDKVKVRRRVEIDVPWGPWHRGSVSEGCTSDESDDSDCVLNFSF
jgi:hypothetical protein